MELYEIPLLIILSLVVIPTTGAFVMAFVYTAWTFIELINKRSEEVWIKQFGLFKSLYAVSFIIGAVVYILLFAYIYLSNDTGINTDFY